MNEIVGDSFTFQSVSQTVSNWYMSLSADQLWGWEGKGRLRL